LDRRGRALAASSCVASQVTESREALNRERARARDLLAEARAGIARLRHSLDLATVDLTLPAPSGSAVAVDREIWGCHVAYARRRDPNALERLVETYLPRAERHARVGTRRASDLEDRLQVAREALVVALQRFDPKRRIPFQPFADATIGGELQKHIRDHGWLVRAPRRVHELVPAIRRSTDQLTQELDRPPTPEEVAGDLGVSLDEVLMAMTAHHARVHQSLDALTSDDQSTYDIKGNVDTRYSLVDDRDALRRALARISSEDQQLINDYFIERLTQQEIADRLGMSQMHVSRRLRRVLRVLAARLNSEN
jgi:RNA polymerase sigma-B factor